MLLSGRKADILSCKGAPTSRSPAAWNVSVMVFDGPAIVHMVKPTKSITFKDYLLQRIVPFLQGQTSAAVNRIDVVWDVYPDESLKAQTQARCGTGPWPQLRPEGSSPIPKRDWQKFLPNIQNKKELFSFIAEQPSQVDINCILVLSTKIDNVVSNQHCEIASLHPFNHAPPQTWCSTGTCTYIGADSGQWCGSACCLKFPAITGTWSWAVVGRAG